MTIDHLGIVVKSLKAGINHWESVFGYSQLTEVVQNTRQKVSVVFLSKKDSLPVKLIEPIGASSPVFSFAQQGGGLHHICFKCDDMKKEIIRLRGNGVRLMVPPQPGEAFENEDISFLLTDQNVNMELISTDKKANKISHR